ncbi:MAG TPA: SDR family NAD(P)-dependent oxidoreductase [Terriglobales bacterium]|nr:SDR family NAD(P)-dependent oxidoreductase [Terriglobales bacterium]
MRLQGKKALVTGTSTGIGREIAKWLTREGASVAGVDWDESGNQETARIIQSAKGSFQALTADVSKGSDVERVFAAAGALDILVNNAASAKGDGAISQITEEAWDEVLAICLKSVFLCTKAALKTMVPKRSGAIVNLSSVNALSGINLSAYTAAKGGILSLTRLIAAHYGGYGIRANAICPGTILSETSDEYYNAHPDIKAELTALYPAGKFGKVEDIAAAVVYLVSDESTFINGTTLTIDGALSAVHRLSVATPKLP